MSDQADADIDVAILLTFDVDFWSGWVDLGATSPSEISRGEFCAVGVGRLLRLLCRRGIHATFFVPGHTARVAPQVVLDIVAHGHEVGHHGATHRRPSDLSTAEEIDELRRGSEQLRAVTGRTPIGYRAPAWHLSAESVGILVDQGFTYDSSMMAGDISPYWARSGDMWTTDGEFQIGRPVDLVELPVAWHRDDVPLFEYMHTGNLLSQGGSSPQNVEEIWLGDFEYLLALERHGMLVYTMHPEVIGHGHRLLMLERILDQMQARPGVRFATCGDYVEAWREGRTPSLPRYLLGTEQPARTEA